MSIVFTNPYVSFPTPEPPPPPPLDLVPGAAAAFDMRKVRTAYTGACMRVLRSSDNAEQDINFNTAGLIDTASLLSFVGASNGLVKIWYDQSGNSRNLVQNTISAMPIIVSSGVLQTRGGIAALTGLGVTRGMTLSSSVGVNITTHVMCVQQNTNVDKFAFIRPGGYAFRWQLGSVANRAEMFSGTSNVISTAVTLPINAPSIAIARYNGASSYYRVNGVQSPTLNAGTSQILGAASIGTTLDAMSFYQAWVIYASALSSTDIDILQNNYNAYYGVY